MSDSAVDFKGSISCCSSLGGLINSVVIKGIDTAMRPPRKSRFAGRRKVYLRVFEARDYFVAYRCTPSCDRRRGRHRKRERPKKKKKKIAEGVIHSWYLTFSQHVASILAAADSTVGDVQRTETQRLMFMSCSSCNNIVCFIILLKKCRAKNRQCTFLCESRS